RLDVACRHEAAPMREAHVARKRGKAGAARDWKIEAPEHGLALRRGLDPRVEPLHETHKLAFRLATQRRVGDVLEQILGVEQGGHRRHAGNLAPRRVGAQHAAPLLPARWALFHAGRYFFRNAWSVARKSGVVRLTALTSAPSRMPSSRRRPSSW